MEWKKGGEVAVSYIAFCPFHHAMRYGTKTRTLVLEHMNLFLAIPNSTFILPTPSNPLP